MSEPRTPRRFRDLPVTEVTGGRLIPVAATRLSRLLGLALLDPGAAPGLLIPDCSCVHTVGMRFALDLHFLSAHGEPVAIRRAVGPCRAVRERGARAVLELPAAGVVS